MRTTHFSNATVWARTTSRLRQSIYLYQRTNLHIGHTHITTSARHAVPNCNAMQCNAWSRSPKHFHAKNVNKENEQLSFRFFFRLSLVLLLIVVCLWVFVFFISHSEYNLCSRKYIKIWVCLSLRSILWIYSLIHEWMCLFFVCECVCKCLVSLKYLLHRNINEREWVSEWVFL